jgi:hypothetical protein
MNKFKLEFINPKYGFRNYKIGEITVYTVRLRFKFKAYIITLFSHLNHNGNIVKCEKYKDIIYISYDTTCWKNMEQMRTLIWDICREIAQTKLDCKYSQLKLEL